MTQKSTLIGVSVLREVADAVQLETKACKFIRRAIEDKLAHASEQTDEMIKTAKPKRGEGKRVMLRVPVELHSMLKDTAKVKRVTMSELVAYCALQQKVAQ